MTATTHQTLLATFRARRDAALARRHDELAVFWGQQSLALARTLADSLPGAAAQEAFALATAVLHLHQPLRAGLLVYPFIDKSLACRVLYTQTCLVAGTHDLAMIDFLTDPTVYQELLVVVDPVPMMPGEVDRVARMWTLRGGCYVLQAKMALAKQCFLRALERDPGAWDAVRALAEFKLLTPQEEVALVAQMDLGGLIVGLPLARKTTARATRRGGGGGGSTASAVESTRQDAKDALHCLVSALIAGTSPPQSPSSTLFSPHFHLDQSLARLDATYALGSSPTTLLASGARVIHSAPPSLAAADRIFTKLVLSIDPQSPQGIVALLDTLRPRRDVTKLRQVAEDLAQSLPEGVGEVLLASQHDPGQVDAAVHDILAYHGCSDSDDHDAAAAAAAANLAGVVPGTATVNRTVLACYAIASYQAAVADSLATDPPAAVADSFMAAVGARAAGADPWDAYMPAFRVLQAALDIDETFVPAVLLLSHVVSQIALLAQPPGSPAALGTVDGGGGLGLHRLLDDAHATVQSALIMVPHAPEPLVALGRVARALCSPQDARRWYELARERFRAAGREGGVEEVVVRGELGSLLAENHALNEGLQLLQDAVTHLRGKVHPGVRAPLVTALVQAIVSMVSQFDDTSTLTATSELRKAHALALDALAATRPARRFTLYTLQGHICEMLADPAGAVAAYHAALRLVPNDPGITRKLHAVAVAKVEVIALRIAERASRERERKGRGMQVRDEEREQEEEEEHDELLPRPGHALSGVGQHTRLVSPVRPRKRRFGADADDDGVDDDDEDMADDFMRHDDDPGCINFQVVRQQEEALAAGMAMDAVAPSSSSSLAAPSGGWVHMGGDSAGAGGGNSRFTAADMDEPTEVIAHHGSQSAAAAWQQYPALTRRGGGQVAPERQPHAASQWEAAATRGQRERSVADSGDGVVNLMGRFGQQRAPSHDDPSATGSEVFPTDSAVGGLTGSSVGVGASAAAAAAASSRPRTRSTGYQQQELDEGDEEPEHADPDSSIDHNSPTVRIAAAAGGPTTRAAARRQQQQAGSSSVTSPSATITPSRGGGRGGRGRGGLGGAAARGARRQARD